jgi:hypothetical protein
VDFGASRKRLEDQRAFLQAATREAHGAADYKTADYMAPHFHGVGYVRALSDDFVLFVHGTSVYCLDRTDFPLDGIRVESLRSTALMYTRVRAEARVRVAPQIVEAMAVATDMRAGERNTTKAALIDACDSLSPSIRVGTYTPLDKEIARDVIPCTAFSPWKNPDFPKALTIELGSAAHDEATFIGRALRPNWDELSRGVRAAVISNIATIYGPDLNAAVRMVVVSGEKRYDMNSSVRHPPEIDTVAKLAYNAGIRVYNIDEEHMLGMAQHDLRYAIGKPMRDGVDVYEDLMQERAALIDAASRMENQGRDTTPAPYPTGTVTGVVYGWHAPYAAVAWDGRFSVFPTQLRQDDLAVDRTVTIGPRGLDLQHTLTRESVLER